MKNNLLILLLGFVLPVSAQQRSGSKTGAEPRHVIQSDLLVPFADFSSTHSWGAAVEYSPATVRRKKPHKITCTWQAGLSFFMGKKENSRGADYRYPDYLMLHAGGSLRYKAGDKWLLQWSAGPGLGRYDGTSRFLLCQKFFTGYSVAKPITVGIVLHSVKESGAPALWSAGMGCLIYLK